MADGARGREVAGAGLPPGGRRSRWASTSGSSSCCRRRGA